MATRAPDFFSASEIAALRFAVSAEDESAPSSVLPTLRSRTTNASLRRSISRIELALVADFFKKLWTASAFAMGASLQAARNVQFAKRGKIFVHRSSASHAGASLIVT